MTRKFSYLSTIAFLAATLVFTSCKEKFNHPVALGDVKLETGIGRDQIIFYARFFNEKGVGIVTDGKLEVSLYQDGQEFFHQVMEVDPERFEPYANKTVQFRSLPFLVSDFTFQPRVNRVGWYDHTLKARYWWKEGQKPLEFTGGYVFRSSLEIEAPGFSSLGTHPIGVQKDQATQ